ncbi:MAG TPA: CRISPR system precrRNA processing endoribonuclease RAMP protein Cas6, partial [Blastocatellia bacterium]|nr:CRISPR system precrRNA processing endoribonuclease RAMP protein Cas6 [Blastocatellia bacterium]
MSASSPSAADLQDRLEPFHLTLLKFTLHAQGAITLPVFAGSTFRGAFGAMFRRLACVSTCEGAASCLLARTCAYARIFEAIPDIKDYQPANEGGLPRPFIIHPPPTASPAAAAGQPVSFHLVLVGQGADYLPYYILAWRELGRIGIGREGGRFRLGQVESRRSLEREEDPEATERELIYSSTDQLVRDHRESITAGRLIADSARWQALNQAGEGSRLNVELLTPARLKTRGDFLRLAPPFEVFLGALLRRLESLSFFYCGRSLELDYQGLIARARAVRIASNELQWVEWERHSRRQNRRIPWGGLLGRVSYEGN